MKRWIDFLFGVPLSALLSLFASKREIPSAPKKILIIKLAAAGDTILLGPVLRTFRAAHPSATIHWLVSPINVALARGNPHVDRLLVWSGGMAALLPLINVLRAEKYDVVCDLEQWSRGTAIIAFLTGAPCRVGFDSPGQRRAALFTKTHAKRFDQNEIDEFYDVLSLLKPLPKDHRFDLAVTEEGRNDFLKLVSFSGKKNLRVLLHPGCGVDGKPREWPLGNYAVLGHWLMKKYDADLFLSSGPEETGKSRKLHRLLSGRAHELGGRLSWQGTIALVNEMDMVVSGNTGVMHVAAALGKKQVALHGPTNALLWGPVKSNARVVRTSCPECPCLKLGFEYHRRDQLCMSKIDPEDVKTAIGGLIDNNKAI